MQGVGCINLSLSQWIIIERASRVVRQQLIEQCILHKNDPHIGRINGAFFKLRIQLESLCPYDNVFQVRTIPIPKCGSRERALANLNLFLSLESIPKTLRYHKACVREIRLAVAAAAPAERFRSNPIFSTNTQ